MNQRGQVESEVESAPTPLTERQKAIFQQITEYHGFMREGCPAAYIGRRLKLHHETVREHFAALFHKGWLQTENSPATPRDFLTRR